MKEKKLPGGSQCSEHKSRGSSKALGWKKIGVGELKKLKGKRND